eukprot:MONOS_12943.1-p1 / transcript=MONOS_12943.1 / gene=MONOS_12943 / organism=Monocercomonoides_exilis_PA203 / gene_product=ribonucleoside-triphosphate reductase [EC:1.17.4.2] / transcript_product=ribonucleoside-triphosphate reductase [EC:1.17.4.2] / location=Mono_scaffold00757:2809-5193(-) / protein_length=795 / sequence_SO=supercontig / SO=protein_coding / is_pseudo=false
MSEIVFYRTYAQSLPSRRKETYAETVQRVENMHIEQFPNLATKIHNVMNFVRERKVVPSMRSMQFAGRPLVVSNARMYNCSFTHIESFRDFADILYLLCCGCGCGYSVQKRHVAKLPVINEGKDEFYQISDSKEGWAESIVKLLENPKIRFDYSLIRPKGSPLSAGGTASGPETLELLHESVRSIISKAVGRQMKPLEIHDILCYLGDLIISGGSRRSALLSLFDVDDEEMMDCKAGWEWFNKHPQRARANNSAVLLRSSPTFLADLQKCVKKCFENGTGEPGIFLTNDLDYGTNPCAEISLKSKQMCNLSEVNVAACRSKEDFLAAVEAATAIGTLQAAYTNFDFLQPEWKKNCEEEALLGVSLTGLAQNWALVSSDGGALLEEAAKKAKEVNSEWAKMLGIKEAARIGCIKPSGTTSALLGTTSGIHAAHASFYLRRVRIESNSPLAAYLLRILNEIKNEKADLDYLASPPHPNSSTASPSHPRFVLSPASTPAYAVSKLADECESIIGLPLIETDVYSRQKLNEEKLQQEEKLKEAKQSSEVNEASDESHLLSSSAASSEDKPLKVHKITDVPISLVVTMPINMSNSIIRSNETALELLDRVAFIHKHFIQPSHRSGPNYHNVSVTVNYKQTQLNSPCDKEIERGEKKEGGEHGIKVKGEEEEILDWLVRNTDGYSGIALFPDLASGLEQHLQLPFEEITEKEYERWMDTWRKLGEAAIRSQMSSHSESGKSEEKSISEETTSSKASPKVDVKSDPIHSLIEGMTKIEWDPNDIDRRQQIIACNREGCQYE